ncbi:MAG: SLBB domain-containing protein [Chitinophagales bacterium]
MVKKLTYNINKVFKLILITTLLLSSYNNIYSQDSKVDGNTKPTSAEIIKAVEDTIGIKIDNLSSGEIERLKARALELQGAESVQSRQKNQTGDGGNDQGNQQGNKQLLDEVKEATEKVEKLVETASEELREDAPDVDIFGFDYIQEREVKLFNSALDVKPPDNYILGPGDEINVNIWGYSDYNEVFTVEKEGYIQPRQVGRVYVKGLRVDEAKKVLLSKFDRVYDLGNSKFDITINYSRVITVNIVGEVINPGSYTLPAINSAFNILAYIGGPSPIGSLRNIQIKRDGEIIDRFDLYRFLFHPERQQDIFLQNNDYLFVPLAQKIVEIRGEVKRQGKYELLQTETFEDLLEYAAGYLPTSFTKSVQVKRYLNNSVYIFDVDLDSLKKVGGQLVLENGDQVTIRKIPEIVDNYIDIKGPLYQPGRYEFKPDMYLSQLIKQTGGFKDEVFTEEAYLTRTRDDFTRYTIKFNLGEILKNPKGEQDIILNKRDEIEIFSKTYFNDPFSISIKGAVRNPRSFKLQEGMSLKDLILLAGGLEKFAYLERGYITRVNKFDNSISYLSFEVDTTNNMASLDSYLIQGNDQVRILSNLDFIQDGRLSIRGAVKNPGTYELWKEITLKDMILISGGLRESAYLKRAYIFRKYDDLSEEIIPVFLDTTNNLAALDEIPLRKNDKIEIFTVDNYKTSFPFEINGLVRNPGVFIYRDKLTLADAITLGGGLKFEASNHRIEIARVSNFEESVALDVPIEIEILYVDASADIINDPIANNFAIKPFDQIFIRKTPGFEFQEKVYLKGEVKYPGIYALKSKDEKLSSLIERAGGLTNYAFLDGAKMIREDRDLGKVFLNMERAMRRPNSKYNYILKEGDFIEVPRIQELVTISGTVAYPFIDADSTISGAFTSGKRAKYYIRNYGTGFTKRSFKKHTYVVYANGQVKDTKRFFGARIYPKVDQGATIHVPYKAPKAKREKTPLSERKSPLIVLESFLATTTSGLTLYLLLDRALE